MDGKESVGRTLPTSTRVNDSTEGMSTVEQRREVCPTVDGASNEARIRVDEKLDQSEAATDELTRAQSLAVGAIHKHYCKDLLEAANTLQSICNVQDTSITLIESKEKVLVELRESYQLEEILDEAQRYLDKVADLRREMIVLSRKSRDLTRRAAYVKSVREKEKARKEQERKRLERLEQDLAPRYSSDLA